VSDQTSIAVNALGHMMNLEVVNSTRARTTCTRWSSGATW